MGVSMKDLKFQTIRNTMYRLKTLYGMLSEISHEQTDKIQYGAVVELDYDSLTLESDVLSMLTCINKKEKK